MNTVNWETFTVKKFAPVALVAKIECAKKIFAGEQLVYAHMRKVASYTGFHLKCRIASFSKVK